MVTLLQFSAEYAGVKMLKIDRYLAKLWARVECPVFFHSRGTITATVA